MEDQRDNPFAPPTAEIGAGPAPTLTDSAPGYPTASQQQRLANILIDCAAYALVSESLLVAAPHNFLARVIAGYPMLPIYYVLCESLAGRTLGKVITRTRVVDLEGRIPSLWQVLGRTLSRFVPFDPISIFFRDDGRCWHDRWSGTRVVSMRAPHVES